jgi:hypothetical protein
MRIAKAYGCSAPISAMAEKRLRIRAVPEPDCPTPPTRSLGAESLAGAAGAER